MFTAILAQSKMSFTQQAELAQLIKSIPQKANEALQLSDLIETLATGFADKRNALFLGRGVHYPLLWKVP